MKHFTTLSLVFIALAMVVPTTGVVAQTYTYTMQSGPQPYTAGMYENSTLLLSGPSNETLTPWQELPFTFTFFGEEVTRYRACDNGYITFDEKSSRASATNASMGTADAPNNAIFGFWEQLELLGAAPEYRQQIRSATFGVSPNRIHVVMWMGVTARISGGGELNFAIVLKEQGGFAIVQTQRSGKAQFRGAIGAENATGMASVFVEGSPTLSFPDMWTQESDDITYEFTSTEDAHDLALVRINAPDLVKTGETYPVGVYVRNDGGTTINSAQLHLTTGRAILATLNLEEPLQPNQLVELTANEPLQAGAAGEFIELAANIVEVDGEGLDDEPNNDRDTHTVYFNRGATIERTPMFEKFTGAWCGNCYDGAQRVAVLQEQYPELIVVAIHAGGTDAMKIPEGQELAAAFRPAFPMAMIDRHLFPGASRLPFGRSNNLWFTRTEERTMAPAVAALSINPTVLWATNALGINVKVDFIDDVAPDDYRLNVYVIENDVTGSGPGYDQRDYGPTGPIHSPYTHLNVLRYTTTGTWGDTTFFPERPMVGESYEGYFRQDINPEYNFLNTTVVAFITRHHQTDPTQREILNAVAYRLDGAVSVDEDDVITREFGIAPNPALDVVNISVPSNDPFVIYSIEGSEVFRGTGVGQPLTIDCSQWAPGMYVIRSGTETKTFVVAG